MSQSASRVPGRGGVPASFGRQAEPADPKNEDFTIRGGEAFHLVLHVQVQPDAESLEALRTAIRENTRRGVLEGYAAAFAEMDQPAEPPAPATSSGG